jgi:hypothetical protein
MVTHIAHLALGQDRVRRLLHGAAIGVVDQPAARQAANLVGGHILTDENLDDARRGLGFGRVNGLDAGVGVGRAHKHRMALGSQGDVVGVLATACEVTVVFLALEGLADVRQFGEVRCTHVVAPEK